MSTFSEKLAMFQKNSNNINSSNKKNDIIQKTKTNEKINTLNKSKTLVKEEDKNVIKLQNNSKITKNFTINENTNESINNKKPMENNQINNNQNSIKKQLLLFENKEKNDSKKNDINKNVIKDAQKNNTYQKNNNSNTNKNNNVQQFLTEEKKDITNQSEFKNQINNSNSLKNRLNIFEPNQKNNENKDIKNKDKIEKDNKQKMNIDKQNKDISSINQKINSIEIKEKSNNKISIKNKIEENNTDNKMTNINNNISDNNIIIKDSLDKKPEIQENKISDFKNEEKESKENEDKKKIKDKTKNNLIIQKNSNKNLSNIDDINKDNNKQNQNNIIKNNSINEIKTINSENILKKSSSKNISQVSNTSNNNNIFLKNEKISESVINDTFCIGFFMVSFNFNKPKIIENSDKLMADCNHIFCSSFPAISPDIYARYPEKDTDDFEISELGASICYPNGIKLCFEKNEMHINGLKNFTSILTNQVGKRYFLSTYHLYFKYSYDEFMNKYEYGNLIDKDLLQKSNLKNIYIPFGICLLSQYPFFNQIEKCLESLRFAIANNNSNPNEIYDLLVYLIKSIPIPSPGTNLNFPLPYFSELITINQPKYKDIFLFGDNPTIILEYFSVEEIIIIMRLLLFEQKILIIGNNYEILSHIIYNFSILLYPMQWVHTFIPIMTEKTIRYLDSFLPFFNGMYVSLFELASSTLENTKENIFIYDLNKHTFQINTFPSLNSKNIIKKINELIPQFPKNILNNITFGLGVVKSYLDKIKNIKKASDENLGENIKIKQVFIQAFIEILYDYKTYLTLLNDKPIFNTKTLLEKRPKADYKFYNEITQTQLFHLFIQNNPVNYKANTFFEEQLDLYDKLTDKKNFMKEFIDNYNKICKINENYFIPPEILENFDVKNPKKIKIQGPLNEVEYKKNIKKKYFIYDTYFKPKSILKSNKLIITGIFTFENNKIASEINYYIFPKVEINNESEKAIVNYSNDELGKELTPMEKDDIKENITDVITKIFKNDEISDPEETEKLILDSLNNDYGIDLYTNSLYDNKNILHKDQFEFLNKLIYSSLNKILISKITQQKKLFYTAQLIKSCENFRTKENSLDNILYPKLSKIQIISDENFWKEYADLFIKDNCSQDMNKDEKWTECIKRMKNIMLLMGLNKTMIYSTLANLGKVNMTENKFSKLMKSIISSLKIYDI